MDGHGTVAAMLVLTERDYRQILSHCLDGLPMEACGLLAGRSPSGATDAAVVTTCYPVANAAKSARLYTVDPRDLLRADRSAEADGVELIGVWHSHTHTEAYPSPTDVAQAPDPGWHYVIVSLRDLFPTLRSYRIVAGVTEEELVVLE
jgi:proteasome lid subunit RPN8/RPN11